MSANDHTAQSGIYQIRCLANNKVYVGGATRFSKRWREHRHHLRRGTHHSPRLQAAWQKHGPDGFIFEIPDFRGKSLSDEHKAKVSATLKGRPRSPETIAKIKATYQKKRALASQGTGLGRVGSALSKASDAGDDS